MKKILKVFGVAVAAAILALTIAGCGKTGNIKAAFINAGYEVTSVSAKDSEDLKGLLKTDEQKEKIGKYSVFVCTNMKRNATVIKFPSVKTMKEVLGESTFDSKTDGGYINGDCYLIVKDGCLDALYIFKNA